MNKFEAWFWTIVLLLIILAIPTCIWRLAFLCLIVLPLAFALMLMFI